MLARANEHSPTTIYGYRAAWKRCESIANIAVEKLRPAHLATLYSKLATSGRHDGAPLSPKSLGHTAALVKALLRWGVDLEIVTRNVATVAAAKPTRGPQKRVKAYDGGRGRGPRRRGVRDALTGRTSSSLSRRTYVAANSLG